MTDEPREPLSTEDFLVGRLMEETGITEQQARRLSLISAITGHRCYERHRFWRRNVSCRCWRRRPTAPMPTAATDTFTPSPFTSW